MGEGLAAGEAHVWLLRPERVGPELERRYLELLDDEERRRHERFRPVEPRRTFLLGRALVRTRLARYSGVAPAAWSFSSGAHGRPEVSGPRGATAPPFNLAHTHGLLACLVAGVPECGVDVERLDRAGALDAIAARHFAPAEAAALAALAEGERRRRFFALWTLKEAYLKARGAGLSLGLDRVLLDPTRRPVGLAFAAGLDDDPASWQLELLAPGPHHLLAVALRRGHGPDLSLVVRECVPLAED